MTNLLLVAVLAVVSNVTTGPLQADITPTGTGGASPVAGRFLAADDAVESGFVQGGQPPQLAPLSTQAYTQDLMSEGYRNGAMGSERLVSVAGCVLERDAAYTLSLMLEAASQDGIWLQPAWCYRSLGEQRATYSRNCPIEEVVTTVLDPETGIPVVDESGQASTSTQTKRVCSVPTASPSTSNHGWGRAIDFDFRGRNLSCGDADFRWMQDNASRFGWVHPDWAHCGRATAEPWHWEWGGLGVVLPYLTPIPGPVEVPAGAE